LVILWPLIITLAYAACNLQPLFSQRSVVNMTKHDSAHGKPSAQTKQDSQDDKTDAQKVKESLQADRDRAAGAAEKPLDAGDLAANDGVTTAGDVMAGRGIDDEGIRRRVAAEDGEHERLHPGRGARMPGSPGVPSGSTPTAHEWAASTHGGASGEDLKVAREKAREAADAVNAGHAKADSDEVVSAAIGLHLANARIKEAARRGDAPTREDRALVSRFEYELSAAVAAFTGESDMPVVETPQPEDSLAAAKAEEQAEKRRKKHDAILSKYAPDPFNPKRNLQRAKAEAKETEEETGDEKMRREAEEEFQTEEQKQGTRSDGAPVKTAAL
jgi:hypothetical protein